LRLGDLRKLPAVDPDAVEDGVDQPVVIPEQGCQQVDRIDFRTTAVGGQRLGPRDRFLGFHRQFVETESHGYLESFTSNSASTTSSSPPVAPPGGGPPCGPAPAGPACEAAFS